MDLLQSKANYLKTHGFGELSLKAVLFDMDGVLFDSMPYHAECWREAAAAFGLHVSPEEVYMNEGRTGFDSINLFAREQWGRGATQKEVDDIYAEKCRLFNMRPEPPKIAGADDVLRCVRSAGLLIACVTGSGQQSLLSRLDRHYAGFFRPEFIVSSRDCKLGKPHPDPYLLGLQRVGVAPNEAVVVENAPLGVEAAVAAGIFTVAVNTGPLPDEALLSAGANALYPSMSAFAADWPNFLSALRS